MANLPEYKIRFMKEQGKRVKNQRESIGISQEQLALKLGYKNKASISRIEAGQNEIPQSKMQAFADALETTIAYLMGWEYLEDSSPTVAEKYVTFPIIGDVAAHYDGFLNEDWTNGNIDIPESWLKGRKREEYFVLRVFGDSMYPMYHDGDLVLVLRQTTMNHSGQIGVVIYDDDKVTLKRVEYVMGEDWMKLSPINPQVPPVVIRGERLEHCRVLGIPKMLIRNIPD